MELKQPGINYGVEILRQDIISMQMKLIDVQMMIVRGENAEALPLITEVIKELILHLDYATATIFGELCSLQTTCFLNSGRK